MSVWNRAETKIKRALKHAGDTHTIDDLKNLISSNKAQLWQVNERTLIITEIIQYPQKKVLNIFIAAGDLQPLLAAIPDLVEYARQNDCAWLQATGRHGWQKKVPNWRSGARSYKMEIEK